MKQVCDNKTVSKTNKAHTVDKSTCIMYNIIVKLMDIENMIEVYLAKSAAHSMNTGLKGILAYAVMGRYREK